MYYLYQCILVRLNRFLQRIAAACSRRWYPVIMDHRWKSFSKSHPYAAAELARNRHLKDTKKGKRCFILGNGPSLRDEDLAQLANEDVFTVNQAARHPQFAALKSGVHFWADPSFFVVDENKTEDLELLDVMKAINTEGNRPMCFFPIKQYDFVKKFRLDESLNVHYFYSVDLFEEYYQGEIDFCGSCPAFCTVVMWCIALAVYMGYSEIYLLGIDTTSIMVNIKSYLKQNDSDDYAYNVGENEKKRLESQLQRQSLETQALSFYRVLQEYGALHRYCQKRNIRLVNCSSVSLVSTLPRQSLTSVLNF